MTENISYIKTKEEPEINVRTMWIPSKDVTYSKRTFIIVPGWASEISLFVKTGKALSVYGNVIIYEPRGFGKSFTPHKKGLFSISEYNNEIGEVIKNKDLQDNNFTIFGSCSGAGVTFSYILDGKEAKPHTLAVISPQPRYETPFWLPILGKIPTFLMNIIQGIIILTMNIYLKFKNPEETKNVIHIKNQLKNNDAWSIRRFIFEWIIPYDIRDRISDINIPMICFIGKKDHFIDLERSKQFLHNPSSEVIVLDEVAHRIQNGNEERMAEETHKFLAKLSY